MKRATKIILLAALALPSAAPACAARSQVDLSIGFQPPLLVPGQTDNVILRVANRGRDSAQGAEVTVVTPFFVNFARPVPPECELHYENPDPFLPEVLVCQLFGTIAPDTERSLAVPVTLAPGGPRGRNYGSALVLPARGSRDRETAPSDNLTQASVFRLPQLGEPAPTGNLVGLYLAGDEVPISLGSRTVTTLTVGNAGPNATSEPTRIIYRTPFFTNIDTKIDLPPGCQMRLTDASPNIPEIVECSIAAGLKVGEERQLRIPLTLVPEGPTGLQIGFGMAASPRDGADVDPIAVDNVHTISLLMLTGPHADSLGPDTLGTTLAGAPARLTGQPQPVPAEAVDLAVASDNMAVIPGTKIISTFRILNRGNVATRSPARLVVVPPFYSNVDRSRLPAGCAVVVSNPEPNIPEVAECTIPRGIAPGEQRTVEIPLDVLPGGPTGLSAGTMFVGVGTDDVEAFVTDNAALFALQRSAVKSGEANEGVDLWVSNDQPAVSLNQPRGMKLRYGNIGRYATKGPSQLVFVTPFYINVDRSSPLPAGCRIQADHPDPLIPETVLCTVPPGLASGEERQVTIPLRLEPGGPAGMLAGKVSIVPDPSHNRMDSEMHYNDNLHDYTIVSVRH